jgi:hypothetical protein
MMYYYWTRHGIRPSVFYGMPPGERLVIRAFFEHEREDIEDVLKSSRNVFPTVDILQMRR